MLIAAPIGIFLAVIVLVLWTVATPIETISVRLSVLGLLFYFGGLILVHELIHAFACPGAGLTSKSLIGVWPSHLSFYAVYMGEMSRERFLSVFLMPLIVITFIPLVIGALNATGLC